MVILCDLVQKNILKAEIYQAKRSRYLLKAIKDEDFLNYDRVAQNEKMKTVCKKA